MKKTCKHIFNENIHIWINTHNMNLEKLVYKNTDIIHYDENSEKNGETYALPILYPTPNRIKNNEFVFEDKTVPSIMHGLAVTNKFDVTIKDNYIEGILDFNKDKPYFKNFPYVSKLIVKIEIIDNSVKYTYSVINNDDCNLPYSLALHPFFKTYDDTKYKVNATEVMEMNKSKLPTGKCLSIKNTKYDITNFIKPSDTDLDDVFCTNQKLQSTVIHPSHNINLDILVSDEFKKCVVYTPNFGDWFCIEPQTSSTNCHNLHNEFFVKEANLQIVPPKNKKTGTVEFKFSEINK